LRIFHTSDWHLGKVFFGKKLLEEQALFFEKEFFPALKELKPDVLVVTGDIIDKPHPDYETLKLLKELLLRLFKEKIFTLFILGNHDSKRISLYKEFLKEGGLLFVDDTEFLFSPLKLTDSQQNPFYFYPFPYLSIYELKEQVKTLPVFKKCNLVETDFRNFINILLKSLEVKKPAIFLGHFAVEYGFFTGEEASLKGFLGEETLPLEIFENFDFLLLGHLHRLQKVKNRFYYAGSILPYSFEEAVYRKGGWFFEIKNNKLLKEEKIFLNSTLPLKVKCGFFEELIKEKKDESYIKVILKNELPVLHAFERLKTIFPNLLVLEYQKEKKRTEEEVSFKESSLIIEREKLDEEEMFKKFYELVEEREVDERCFKVYKKYLEAFKKELQNK